MRKMEISHKKTTESIFENFGEIGFRRGGEIID
jgi:hypothetical protein